MKRVPAAILGVALIAGVSAVSSQLASAASNAGAPPCTPKITTIKGHRAGINCGPATASLTIHGKTYTYSHGFCEKSKAAGTALELTLGTTVLGDHNGNAGQPSLDITILKNRAGSVGFAYYGGKNLLKDALPLINVKGNIPSAGTFTSSSPAVTKFTGSWNCHGVVWQSP